MWPSIKAKEWLVSHNHALAQRQDQYDVVNMLECTSVVNITYNGDFNSFRTNGALYI